MGFPDLWWGLGALLSVALYMLGHYLCRMENISQVGLYEIDRMTRKDFREFCRRLLVRVGYQVERPKTAGKWIGFILEKDGTRMGVMVKQSVGPVSARPVERAAEGASRNRCHRAIVLSNREFTREARERARELGVELWDRDKLADLLILARSSGK